MKIKSYSPFALIAMLLIGYQAKAQVLQPAESIGDVGILLLISFTIFLLLLVMLWLVRVARQLRKETQLKRDSLTMDSNTAKA
jgi:heme/copper-type cytochrome/quinol oxidase subunit 2